MPIVVVMPDGGLVPTRTSWLVGYLPRTVTAVSCRWAWEWRMSIGRTELVRWAMGLFGSRLAGLLALTSKDAKMPEKPNPIDDGEALLVPHAEPGGWGKMFPHLVDWMTSSSWADKTPRRGCLLMISARGGVWRATLKDYDLGNELEVTVPKPEQALPALEALLGAPKAPWRADPNARPARRNGRK